MSVARVTEITASSKKSFDDAMKSGLKRATQTLKNVQAVAPRPPAAPMPPRRLSDLSERFARLAAY